MSRASYLTCWFMALLVALAPIPFGSVYPVPLALIQVMVALVASVWIVLRMRAGLAPLPWNDPILIGGAAFLAYGLLQILPIPVAILRHLSPGSAALWTTYSPTPPAWASLSIDPYATWLACLLTACWTLAAVVVRHNAVDFKGRLTIACGFAAGGMFQAGYGLFEFISGRQKILWYEKTAFTDVATGTFVSRNNYAGYLEMALPFALALALLGTRRAGQAHRHAAGGRLDVMDSRTGFRTILLLLVAFLMAIAVLMSRSRMGIMSLTFALIAAGLFFGLKRKARRFALVSVVVIGLAAVFATQIDILPVIKRFKALEREFGQIYGRLPVWTQAMPLLANYPLFGSGMGTWEMAFSPYRDDAIQVRVDFAHNDYLEFFAEAGVAGTIIMTSSILFGVSRKRRHQVGGGHQDEIGLAAGIGLLSIGLHSVTDFHLSIPANALAVSVLLGLFLRPAGPTEPLRADARSDERSRALRSVPGGIACIAVILALGVAAASPAAAHVRSRRAGIPQENIGDVDAAVPDIRAASPDEALCSACPLDPFNSARHVEAGSRARRRLLRDVETLVRARTVGVNPEHATRLYLARRIDASLEMVRQGLNLSPARARGHLEVGLLHFGRFALTGLPPASSMDFQFALDAFSRSMTLTPWQAAWHRKVALITIPLYQECSESQKRFIEMTVRRARDLNPRSRELRDAAARLGL